MGFKKKRSRTAPPTLGQYSGNRSVVWRMIRPPACRAKGDCRQVNPSQDPAARPLGASSSTTGPQWPEAVPDLSGSSPAGRKNSIRRWDLTLFPRSYPLRLEFSCSIDSRDICVATNLPEAGRPWSGGKDSCPRHGMYRPSGVLHQWRGVVGSVFSRRPTLKLPRTAFLRPTGFKRQHDETWNGKQQHRCPPQILSIERPHPSFPQAVNVQSLMNSGDSWAGCPLCARRRAITRASPRSVNRSIKASASRSFDPACILEMMFPRFDLPDSNDARTNCSKPWRISAPHSETTASSASVRLL